MPPVAPHRAPADAGGARVAANAAMNAVRGVSLLAVTLALPAVLVRVIDTAALDAWILISQLAAYATFLDIGLQTAVAKFVAEARAHNDARLERVTIGSGTALLAALALVGAVLTAVLVWRLPAWFRGLDPALIGSARTALGLLAVASLLGLPASAWIGAIAGHQRTELTAAVVVVSNVVGAAGVATAAVSGASLAVMAGLLAGARVVGHGMHYILVRRLGRGPVLRGAVEAAGMARLARFASTLAVWSAGMLMVTGLDATIVGRVDYARLSAYGVSASLIALLVGLQSAALTALIPATSALHARGHTDRLGEVVIVGSRIAMALLLAPSTVLAIWAPTALRLWLGDSPVAHDAVPLLRVLIVANVIRLSCGVYSAVLIGAGEHRRVVLSPLVEGVTNVVVSVTLGLSVGAIGVAWGTLVGAVSGVAMHLLYNVPRTRSFTLASRRLIVEGMVRPLLGIVPVAALAGMIAITAGGSLQRTDVAAAGAVVTIAGIAVLGLAPADRARGQAFGRPVLRRLRTRRS